MRVLTTTLRILDALATAVAVTFGLIPDPTRTYVPVRRDREEERP